MSLFKLLIYGALKGCKLSFCFKKEKKRKKKKKNIKNLKKNVNK